MLRATSRGVLIHIECNIGRLDRNVDINGGNILFKIRSKPRPIIPHDEHVACPYATKYSE